MVADLVAVAERVANALPVGAGDDERLGVLRHPRLDAALLVPAPQRAEVHVLDPAGLVALVDEDPRAAGLALDVAHG